MTQFREGDVVICGTGQAGTVVQAIGRDLMVLTTNGEIWMGSDSHCYHPADDVLAAAPLERDRFDEREKAPKPKRQRDRFDD
jgi:hypothetical protein